MTSRGHITSRGDMPEGLLSLPAFLLTCLPTYLFVDSLIYLLTCLFACLAVCLIVLLLSYQPACLPPYLSLFLSFISLFFFSLFFFLFLFPSLPLSIIYYRIFAICYLSWIFFVLFCFVLLIVLHFCVCKTSFRIYLLP